MTSLKRTPLYEAHQKLGGKIVPFAGWELPVFYAGQNSGVIAEHHAVRNKAGLFDVSHMGEITVKGPDAERALNYLTCNDVSSLYDGKAQYSALLNEKGGVIDDIIIYRYSPTNYLICVNASNADKDFAWLTKNNTFDCEIKNVSADYGQLALQGPSAVSFLVKQFGLPELQELKYFHFVEKVLDGVPTIIARTGYTGEDGVELFVPAALTEKLWNTLLTNPEITPAGLGARDSLRLEATYPLHGHELGEDLNALESGLGWIVKFKKDNDFIGREALEASKKAGLKKSLVGFFLSDAGIAREGDKISDLNGVPIGVVTSGTKTPTVNKALGLALIAKEHAAVGSKIVISVRDRKLNAEVVKTPFYSALRS